MLKAPLNAQNHTVCISPYAGFKKTQYLKADFKYKSAGLHKAIRKTK